ncbi:MAG: hypothetical protein JW892_05545 [Anaerolineae bacterium]|nr:hypothetical protein [Anaerolineae bacterium]
MSYDARIQAAESDPQQLEQLFQAARRSDEVGDFRAAMLALHEAAPENVLLTAWVYRLQSLTEETGKVGRSINWAAAIPLSIVTGLILWAISGEELALSVAVPQVFLWWSPIATLSALTFMALTARRDTGRALALGLGLLAAAAYVVLLEPAFGAPWASEQYLTLAMIHIPLLSWTALGIYTLGLRSSAIDRFAFLIKSLEVMIVAGLYLGAGVAFGGITMGLFTALGIILPDVLTRLIMVGGFGLLPVLALATIYDPRVAPAAQDFEQGLSKFIATMMRLLLPLTLVVLVVYVLVIPFNFFAPFESRELLIVYNVMLFAIIGLLMGATPINGVELSSKLQKVLRLGILLVAGLAVLVSVYALSAVVYRTFQGELTPNRLTVIGWNGINIAILAALLVTQLRKGRERWIEALHAVFSRATNAYLVWGLFLLVALPILF